jgi:hypothetical protein
MVLTDAVGSESQSKADYDRAYRQWEIDSRLIESRLQAYYPGEPLAKGWDQISKGVGDLYANSQTGSRLSGEAREKYLDEFGKGRNALFGQVDELNSKILNTPIAVFH